ncbi:hypothetical protein [Dyella mobilis]|uniref:Uncharacterized protein n=1 Tax=Dyella mobilis TaxID=1849582 RepID=A0ABS2KE96_9GAMM|nr:hypothetical protein [Dyella mobilis]MBM7129087.1 hypothetical protein [Dyella mobilis]
MKTPSMPHAALPSRRTRGFGLIAMAVLFLLSVFQLTHLPAAPASHDAIDLWRGLAEGSLFVFFCLPAGRNRQPKD